MCISISVKPFMSLTQEHVGVLRRICSDQFKAALPFTEATVVWLITAKLPIQGSQDRSHAFPVFRMRLKTEVPSPYDLIVGGTRVHLLTPIYPIKIIFTPNCHVP